MTTLPSQPAPTEGRPAGVIWGQNRISGKLIWYRDFAHVRPVGARVSADISFIAQTVIKA